MVDFELQNPETSESYFSRSGIEIASTVVPGDPEAPDKEQPRHLYFWQADNEISIPTSNNVMFQVVWKKVHKTQIAQDHPQVLNGK